jgi:hypothetical protein
MKPEGSIPCSQKPSTGPYPEPLHLNIVHPLTSLSSQWSFPFWFSHQYIYCEIKANFFCITADIEVKIIIGCNQFFIYIFLRDWAVTFDNNFVDLYSEDIVFECQPRNRLGTEVLRRLLQISETISWAISRLGHDRFLSNPFHFIIHQSSYHIPDSESPVNWPSKKKLPYIKKGHAVA